MYNEYIKRSLISVFVLLTGFAAFNWLVNPYDIFDAPVYAGVNIEKPAKSTRQRLSKAYVVKKLKPKVIIAGTSRMLVFDPHNQAFSDTVAFNLALPGSSLYEHFRYIQHAHYINKLDTVILGLDPGATGSRIWAGFDEQRLSVDMSNKPQTRNIPTLVYDKVLALLTLSATKSSFKTITYNKQMSEFPKTEAELMLERVSKKGGHRAMFFEYEKNFLKNARKMSTARDCPAPLGQTPTDIYPVYQKLLNFAHQEGIELIILITPEHARHQELRWLTGRWPSLGQWRKDITTLNERVANQTGMSPFPIWDFSGYSKYNTEPVPKAGDSSTLMRWYWEDSHITRAYSDEIINLVYNDNETDLIYNDLAVRLTSDNIEQHYNNLCKKRQEYVRKHQQDINELAELAKETGILK
jgi:hypothetical protein